MAFRGPQEQAQNSMFFSPNNGNPNGAHNMKPLEVRRPEDAGSSQDELFAMLRSARNPGNIMSHEMAARIGNRSASQDVPPRFTAPTVDSEGRVTNSGTNHFRLPTFEGFGPRTWLNQTADPMARLAAMFGGRLPFLDGSDAPPAAGVGMPRFPVTQQPSGGNINLPQDQVPIQGSYLPPTPVPQPAQPPSIQPVPNRPTFRGIGGGGGIEPGIDGMRAGERGLRDGDRFGGRVSDMIFRNGVPRL